MTHIDIIRLGVPMEVVKSFYDYALKQIGEPECKCAYYENEIDMNCVHRVFDENLGFATRRLLNVLSEDLKKPMVNRYFPHMSTDGNLSSQGELEKKASAESLEATLSELLNIEQGSWEGSRFPSDEMLWYSKGIARACEEFQGRMDENSLWLSATTLTAYVLGLVRQILLLPHAASAAEFILAEHIHMVYTGLQCKRQTGDMLQVPAIFLEGFVTRAHLTLKNSSIGPSAALVAGLPDILSLPEIVRGSDVLFPEAVRQMSSLSSYGRSKFLSWNGTDVSLQNMTEVLRANATLQRYSTIFSDGSVVPKTDVTLECFAGYRKIPRLKVLALNSSKEECCHVSCLHNVGSIVKLSIMNEMCCEACNGMGCNVEDLGKVIQTQTFGYERQRESSVANVW